jgi:hypothetical protein
MLIDPSIPFEHRLKRTASFSEFPEMRCSPVIHNENSSSDMEVIPGKRVLLEDHSDLVAYISDYYNVAKLKQ